MSEYTFEEIIMNPEVPGLEDIIGKEVYYSDAPLYCLRLANNDYRTGILREIRENSYHPFRVETPKGDTLSFACIIVHKNRPKFRHTPLKDREENPS